VRRHGSRGAAGAEYALLIALLGGVLCVGLATVAKDVFENGVCSLGQAFGVDFCAGSELPTGPPGDSGFPTDEPSVHIGRPPQPTPCATASPTPTSTSPAPSATCTPNSS
jgi:hypothetical protein